MIPSIVIRTRAIDFARPAEMRREAYDCDITYGTNNEYGFDYLRDNLAVPGQELAQPELTFAIVDEVDSILIDEARTPLIISGQAEASSDLYVKMDRIIRQLKRSATTRSRKSRRRPSSLKTASGGSNWRSASRTSPMRKTCP